MSEAMQTKDESESRAENIRKKLIDQLTDADAAFCVIVSDVDTETGNASMAVARFMSDDMPEDERFAIFASMDEAAVSEAHPVVVMKTLAEMGLPVGGSSESDDNDNSAIAATDDDSYIGYA